MTTLRKAAVLATLVALGVAGSADAKPKVKPKPRIAVDVTRCVHMLSALAREGYDPQGREVNWVGISVWATSRGKPVHGARLRLRLTGPDVIRAGGNAGSTERGTADSQAVGSPVFGADGTYTLRWTVSKKGYRPGQGRIVFAAVAGREAWYGEYRPVACEGWTPDEARVG